jgi:hypothetical protein
MTSYNDEVSYLLARLVRAGFALVECSHEYRTLYTLEKHADFLSELCACDEVTLTVRLGDAKPRRLFLVFGNSPGELVSDWSIPSDVPSPDALETILDAYAKHFST